MQEHEDSHCDYRSIAEEAQRIRQLREQDEQTGGHKGVHRGPEIRDLKIEGSSVSFLYQGDMKELVEFLTQIAFTDITITEPDLNEIFMHFYE